MSKRARGLFIAGTDTGVGKTYVAALIARDLRAAGREVGVYKPVASGCLREGDTWLSEDALTLWRAAGEPGDLERVCPQRFAAPLAPHLAAQAEGRAVDARLLRAGLDYWRDRSDVVIVEGAGGLLSPVTEQDYVLNLAAEFAYPLIVVSRNALGTIHQTLTTLLAAKPSKLPIAGIVLNRPLPVGDDLSVRYNRRELAARCGAPVLAELPYGATAFNAPVDWHQLAGD